MQEVGFKEAFWPLYEMEAAEPTTWTNLGLRASFALLATGICWLLYAKSPDKGTMPRRHCKQHDTDMPVKENASLSTCCLIFSEILRGSQG